MPLKDDDVIEVPYRCVEPRCQAEDHGAFFRRETIPLAINCWSCHSGRGLHPDDMLAKPAGMHVTDPSLLQRIGQDGDDSNPNVTRQADPQLRPRQRPQPVH